jgi:hypothetical protein
VVKLILIRFIKRSNVLLLSSKVYHSLKNKDIVGKQLFE